MTKKQAYNKIKKRLPATQDEYLLAVSYDGNALMYIPSEALTEGICIKALETNKWSSQNLLQYIPERLMTKQFALKIIETNYKNLEHLPANLICDEIIVVGITQSLYAFEYIPEKYRTPSLYKKLVDVNPDIIKHIDNPSKSLSIYTIKKSPSLIKYINPKFLSQKLYAELILSNWKVLKYLPKKEKTEELCLLAFNQNYRAFQYFPDEFKTSSLCEAVVENNPLFLKHCPKILITEELCLKCVNKKGETLEYVPQELKTAEMCEIAINNNWKSIEFIPQKLITNDLIFLCIQKDLLVIPLIPNQNKTYSLYKFILEQIDFSKEFKDWLLFDEKHTYSSEKDFEIYKLLKNFIKDISKNEPLDFAIIAKERDLCIRQTLESFYDIDTDKFYVVENYYKQKNTFEFNSLNEYYNFLNGNLNKANLTEYNFNGIDISKYNLTGAYLPSSILIKHNEYDESFYNSSIKKFREEVSFLPVLSNETVEAKSISHFEPYTEKLNSITLKVFYITDIHLDHKLCEQFPVSATFDEIYFFIKKYVKKMVDSAYDKSSEDLLFIGGDVSFCFQISKIFYEELAKKWEPSKIIVILGNHELWNFNKGNSSAKTFNEITNEYRLMLSKYSINFLQNEVFILNRNYEYSILSEKNILDATPHELREKCSNNSIIVFGGIGFSAYNDEFNATNGIYGDILSSIEEDILYTKQTETLYSKLVKALPLDKVICFSHMPLSNWSKQPPMEKWIYVSGHTHRNYYELSEKCTIYADNQMGYKAKSASLKYFKSSKTYDIFKYYTDGIYHITKEQYLNFNLAKNIYCEFNKNVEIIMLKHGGFYLFLVKDKKLYILNGGVKKALPITDIKYYFDNMIVYANIIKKAMKSYNLALSTISDIVKRFGGDGTIHGCIIDIDFYNHIYLDPQDGSIKFYCSPFYGVRQEYPNLDLLLKEQLPDLYSNYSMLIGTEKGMSVFLPEINFNEAKKVIDTSIYKPSKLIKNLQYITEDNIIREWNDDLIQTQAISESNLILE